MAVRNLLVKPPELDTRVSITLHRKAVLALFARGTRNETDARVFADGIARVRTRLLNLNDAIEAITADSTLTREYQLVQAAALCDKVRPIIAKTFAELAENLHVFCDALKAGFETELESADVGHGLSSAELLQTAQVALDRAGGSRDGAVQQFVQSAIAARDGKMLRVIYKQPGYLLGVSDAAASGVRLLIAQSWNAPFATRMRSYERVESYLSRAAKIADKDASLKPNDAKVAARAAGKQQTRQSAVAGAEGEAS